MLRYILMPCMVLWMAAACGCAGDMDENLPPPRLGTPVVSHVSGSMPRQMVAMAMPAVPPAAAPALTSPVAVPAAWIPSAPTNHWVWIIVHHSDSAFGSAADIDRWHRARGFDELGYHFVIGNGTDSGDGQIEVGPRWTKQKWGAHDNALDNRYNTQGIGICLVGDFNKTQPTAAQRRALIRLIVYLMKTYHVPVDHVLGHGETKVTQCPGKYLNMNEIRAAVAQMQTK